MPAERAGERTMAEELLDAETIARGKAIRRRVLGDRHVEGSYAVDELSRAKTQLSEYVWSRIWARPGLPPKSRSIACLAMLTALNRPHELKLHVGAALNNGLTKDEIGEVLLQTGSYCGIAAAEEAFRIAEEAFRERGV